MTEADVLEAAIGGRWAAVQRRIQRAADLARRDPAEIKVVAVTKGFGVDAVRAAAAVGLDDFGENRVQEAEPKIAAVPNVGWHLVGHLQSNKARRAVSAFGVIHAVDSIDLLDRLETMAQELDVARAVLFQVNLTGAEGQHGFDLPPFEAGIATGELVAAIDAVERVRVVGLMGIGPLTSNVRASRAAFARLRELRDRLQDAGAGPLPELSMGMSGDLEAAVAEGATLVRLGTALFGDRPATD